MRNKRKKQWISWDTDINVSNSTVSQGLNIHYTLLFDSQHEQIYNSVLNAAKTNRTAADTKEINDIFASVPKFDVYLTCVLEDIKIQ